MLNAKIVNPSPAASKGLDSTQNESRSRGQTVTRDRVEDVPENSPRAILQDWKKQGLNECDIVHLLLLTMSTRLFRLCGQIDEAFSAEAFIPGTRPDDPANQRRLNAYVSDFSRTLKLFEQFIETTGVAHEMFAKVGYKSKID